MKTNSQLQNNGQIIYTRQQKGHSVILTTIACFMVIGIPFAIYWAVSPNHYWHL